MAQVPEKKIQNTAEKCTKKINDGMSYKFNARAREFVPRTYNQMPVSGHFYPGFNLLGRSSGGGSDCLFVGCQEPPAPYLISNPAVVAPPHRTKTILTDELKAKDNQTGDCWFPFFGGLSKTLLFTFTISDYQIPLSVSYSCPDCLSVCREKAMLSYWHVSESFNIYMGVRVAQHLLSSKFGFWFRLLMPANLHWHQAYYDLLKHIALHIVFSFPCLTDSPFSAPDVDCYISCHRAINASFGIITLFLHSCHISFQTMTPFFSACPCSTFYSFWISGWFLYIWQMEYQFSNMSLLTNESFMKHMTEDPDGYGKVTWRVLFAVNFFFNQQIFSLKQDCHSCVLSL